MELISSNTGQLEGMTIITPIIEPNYVTNYVPERAQVFHARNKRKLAKGLFISTLLHLIGLALVIVSTTFESGVTPALKPAPISATLYFPQVSVEKTNTEVSKPAEITPSDSELNTSESPPAKVIDSAEQIKAVEDRPVESPPQKLNLLKLNVTRLHRMSKTKLQRISHLKHLYLKHPRLLFPTPKRLSTPHRGISKLAV